ncbi:MAG: ABC transporter permease [Marmoricola sp.]
MSDFTPRPGGAPFLMQVRAQATMEAKLMLRNGEQLLLAIVIPLIVLVGIVEAAKHLTLHITHRPVDEFTPGVLALAIMSTSFTSLAIATGFERRYGVIKRLGASPLSRTGLLLGKVLALILVELLQIVVVGVAGLLLGWSPQTCLAAFAGSLLTIAAATAAFGSLGLLVAGVLRAEATLAAANLIYLLLMAGGAVVLPTTSYGAFGHVARWLPSGALGNGLRDALINGHIDGVSLLVLAGWAVVGATLTARTFQWE